MVQPSEHPGSATAYIILEIHPQKKKKKKRKKERGIVHFKHNIMLPAFLPLINKWTYIDRRLSYGWQFPLFWKEGR
jgi:hypothetical protein